MSLSSSKTCIRSYNHSFNKLTDVKTDFLETILLEYRRVAGIMMSKQIIHFFKFGKIDTSAKLFYGDIETFFIIVVRKKQPRRIVLEETEEETNSSRNHTIYVKDITIDIYSDKVWKIVDDKENE
jgi:hypothetical protein